MPTKTLDNELLSQEAQERVQAASRKLLDDSLGLCDHEALQAMGALLLAAGTAAAWARLDYKQMVELISTYYENALLNDAQRELQGTDPQVYFGKKGEGSN